MEEKRKKDLATLGTLAAALLIFYFIFRKAALLYLSLAVLATGVFFRETASALAERWLKFSGILSDFNARWLLRLIYYAILTPVAFLFRLAHRDPLKTAKDTAVKSYFLPRDHIFSPSDFEKMW